MFKALFIGVWVIGLLSGSVYFFGSSKSENNAEAGTVAAYFGGLEYIEIGSLNITIIRDNEIKGYLILDPVITIKKVDLEKFSVPLEFLLKDMIITTMHEKNNLDVYRLDKFDVSMFQAKLLEDLNKKLGSETVQDILIQQIDFVSKEDIRDLNLRRN